MWIHDLNFNKKFGLPEEVILFYYFLSFFPTYILSGWLLVNQFSIFHKDGAITHAQETKDACIGKGHTVSVLASSLINPVLNLISPFNSSTFILRLRRLTEDWNENWDFWSSKIAKSWSEKREQSWKTKLQLIYDRWNMTNKVNVKYWSFLNLHSLFQWIFL